MFNVYVFLLAVDASAAGKGQLEIDSDLPIRDYKPLGDRVFMVKYVAKRVGPHELNVKYNSIVVEGTPPSLLNSSHNGYWPPQSNLDQTK